MRGTGQLGFIAEIAHSLEWQRSRATVVYEFTDVIGSFPARDIVIHNAIIRVAKGQSTSVISRVAGQIAPVGVVGDRFRFTFTGITGFNYVVEYKNELEANIWLELERRPGSGGLETITDSTSTPNLPGATRVYRVKVE